MSSGNLISIFNEYILDYLYSSEYIVEDIEAIKTWIEANAAKKLVAELIELKKENDRDKTDLLNTKRFPALINWATDTKNYSTTLLLDESYDESSESTPARRTSPSRLRSRTHTQRGSESTPARRTSPSRLRSRTPTPRDSESTRKLGRSSTSGRRTPSSRLHSRARKPD